MHVSACGKGWGGWEEGSERVGWCGGRGGVGVALPSVYCWLRVHEGHVCAGSCCYAYRRVETYEWVLVVARVCGVLFVATGV